MVEQSCKTAWWKKIVVQSLWKFNMLLLTCKCIRTGLSIENFFGSKWDLLPHILRTLKIFYDYLIFWYNFFFLFILQYFWCRLTRFAPKCQCLSFKFKSFSFTQTSHKKICENIFNYFWGRSIDSWHLPRLTNDLE